MSKMAPAEWQPVAQLCVVCCVVLKCLLLLSAFITHKVCTVFFLIVLNGVDKTSLNMPHIGKATLCRGTEPGGTAGYHLLPTGFT